MNDNNIMEIEKVPSFDIYVPSKQERELMQNYKRHKDPNKSGL